MRTLLILIALLLVWFIARHLWSRSVRLKHQSTGQKPVQEMLRCGYCNVFVPRDQAIQRHGQSWCCEDHARKGHKS